MIIEPGEGALISVTATQFSDVGRGATIGTFKYPVVADEYVTFSLYPSSTTSPVLEPGEAYTDSLLIESVVFDPDVQYTLQITEPQTLDLDISFEQST